MGVPMSKSDNSGSELSDSGHLYGCVKDDHTNRQTNNEEEYKQASNTDIPKQLGQETETIQMLCEADDDDIDDKELLKIYSKLKTNKSTDLHIARTKYDANKTSKIVGESAGPVFTSTVAERPTRVTSANFSPHAIPSANANNRMRATVAKPLDLSEDSFEDSDDIQERPAAPTPSVESIQYDIPESSQSGKKSLTVNNIGANDENDELLNELLQSTQGNKDNVMKIKGNNTLQLPHQNRRLQSPTPTQTCLDDLDFSFDPFEGMDIPRERVRSFGSASIYSVKEISDELYREYFYEIRNCIRTHGFFDKFPSPDVVSDAQRTYRRMEIPAPADEDGNILPYPPKVTKSEVFASQTKSFDEVDFRIVNAPVELVNGSQTSDVVHYLCAGLDDDLSKIRAVSTWLAIRQMQSADGRKQKADSSEGWCKSFRAMCRYSRIKTKLIHGILRGPTYIPGDDLEKHRGCWVGVLVNNTWWAVDPVVKVTGLDTASGTLPVKHVSILDKQSDQSLFRHAESFFGDPEQFIFTHYPDDEYWQLLARPVNRDELADLAVLRQGFFNLGMKVINTPRSVIVMATEETTVSLGYPEHSQRQFMCKLFSCSGSSSLETDISLNRINKINMRRFAFLEMVLNKHILNVKVKFPRKGSYILDVFGCSETQPWQKLATYRFVYENPKLSTPYPLNSREEWGPGFEALRFGLVSLSHHTGTVFMDKGVVQIVFKDKKGLQFKQELLKDNTQVENKEGKISFLRGKDHEIVFIIDIEPNSVGMYVAQLSARSDTSKPFQIFCNYLVQKVEAFKSSINIKRKDIAKFPFNVKLAREEKVVIQAPESGQLRLTVNANGLSQISVELKLHDRQELNFSEHARHWIQDDQGFIELNFPRAGKYSVKIIGRNSFDKRFRTLREETIFARIPSEKWSPFPKLENNWGSFYKIEAPLTHHLEEKQDVLFSVIIQGAHDVAVLAPNGWYHLDQVEDGLWTGQVWTGPKSTKCKMLARFEIGSEKFSDLLWFKVMAEEDFERMEDRQEDMREHAQKTKEP